MINKKIIEIRDNLKHLSYKNIIFILFMVQLCSCKSIINDQINYRDILNIPDIERNTAQIIESRGFIPETHFVTTEDGYILGIFRIINPYPQSNKTIPILLQHGFLGNSDIFLVYSEGMIDSNGIYKENAILKTLSCDGSNPTQVGNNLGFVLSACGYDVWLGNWRGNRYSKNHTFFNPKRDVDFWRFSFDQIAQYDLPAITEYILNVTNKSTFAYIGHSMGSGIALARLSTDPSFERFLKPIILIGPAVFLGNILGTFRTLAEIFGNFLIEFHGVVLPNELLYLPLFSSIFCGTIGEVFCSMGLMSIFGFNFEYLNMSRIPVFYSHFLDVTSMDYLTHLAQEVKSKRFRKFDYGTDGNLRMYGQLTPPDYPIANITSENIAVIYGYNDFLGDVNDIEILKKEFKVKLIDDYLVPYSKWSHYDFFFSSAAGYFSNSRILHILTNFFSLT